MNFAVHTVMYGYYALKAMRINVPRRIAFVITVAQIVQMIWGLIFNFHVFAMKIGIVEDNNCQCSYRAAVAGAALYSLFFYYFVEFFIGAYFRKRAAKRATSASSQPMTNGKLHHHEGVHNGITDEKHQMVSNNGVNDMNNNATPERKNGKTHHKDE